MWRRMGWCIVGLGCVSLLLSVSIGLVIFKVMKAPVVPDIRLEHWGAGPSTPDDKSIRPFKVHFPEAELSLLKEKLSLTRPLVPPLEGARFEYGMNTDVLAKFLDYWRTSYNWTEREAYLNRFPHYITQIGGLDIHFLHAKPTPQQAKGKEILPLLLVHGWPGSVREFYDMIPLLTTPREGVVFEVIAPSLPGFGFSEGSVRPGMGAPQIAVIFAELMDRLGFSSFYYQAGDWGAIIGHAMAVLFPGRVLGFHSNFCHATTPGARLRALLSWLYPSFYAKEIKVDAYKEQFFDIFIVESAYVHVHATKPDTIGVALTDSPAGLAGYILEKFSTGTNKAFRMLPGGGLDTFPKDDLLDNIMIYWLTKSITTSIRLYSQHFNKETYSSLITSVVVNVPTHCARFPYEILFYPRSVLEAQYSRLVSVTDFEVGGHFAALEQPRLLADDFWAFVIRLRQQEKTFES